MGPSATKCNKKRSSERIFVAGHEDVIILTVTRHLLMRHLRANYNRLV